MSALCRGADLSDLRTKVHSLASLLLISHNHIHTEKKCSYGFAECPYKESDRQCELKITVTLGVAISLQSKCFLHCLLHIIAPLNQDEPFLQTAKGSKKSLETPQFGLKISVF